jgi:maltose O-acetyltransferase
MRRHNLRDYIPPREFALNVLASRIPLTNTRQLAYELLGVEFEERSSTNIMMHTEVQNPKGIVLGARTIVGRHCHLDGRGGLQTHADVNISSYAQLITAGHDVHSTDFSGSTGRIEIGARAWIATAAIVLQGVTVGEGAVVAAGSLVRADVAPFTVVGGVPARVIGTRREDLAYELSHRRNWL